MLIFQSFSLSIEKVLDAPVKACAFVHGQIQTANSIGGRSQQKGTNPTAVDYRIFYILSLFQCIAQSIFFQVSNVSNVGQSFQSAHVCKL
mmetsp:Transcript_8836/g.16672  ORF Transcript_8836/g.16672 Transcript_8836/m.16672 type:complete len:90 (+) Transcript_8836:985-1254(+)